jgi:adenylate cyclase
VKRKGLLRFAIVLLATAIAAVGVFFCHDIFERPAWPVYDFLQRSTALEKSDDVVLVMITQVALDRIEAEHASRWPWPRELYADLMDVAKNLGAKSVIFDINFANPSSYGVSDDESFNASLKRNQITVVMPGPGGQRMKVGPNETLSKDLGSLLKLGVTIIPQEEDGIYRRMPSQIGKSPPLGFAQFSQISESPLAARDIWMRFYRAGGLPFVDINNVFSIYTRRSEKKELSHDLAQVENLLRGKNWVIGAAAPGLLDLKPTPVNPFAPGAEIHATALANIISHQGVHFFSRAQTVAAAVLISLLVFSILLFSSTPIPALVGASCFSILGPFAATAVIWSAGAWFNPLSTLAVSGVLALVILGVRFQLEWRERQRLAKSVENSMSSEMVEMIRSGKLKLARFGERREISIFFCDLSGFTTISESLDAGILVDVLNLYLGETVDLIFKNRGFVDKFIGDAVMAFWGAPAQTGENHAAAALKTAIEFQASFASFRTKAALLIGESARELSARVGVHTGTVIVGNIGAHSRYNYTAIGDPVNLASRLEGLGKQYESDLLISEEI